MVEVLPHLNIDAQCRATEANQRGTVVAAEKFRLQNPKIVLPDLEIESETSYSSSVVPQGS